MNTKTLLTVLMIGAFAVELSARNAPIIPASDAMGDRFPDQLFVVKGPYETRGEIDLARSKGLVPLMAECVPLDYKSLMGRLWFVYNNRGEQAGKRDALSLIIVKARPIEDAGRSGRVLLNAYRSDSAKWYRGGVRTYFNPSSRTPLHDVTLARWNYAHKSKRTSAYDGLFGRKPRDRFHAAPNPYGVSSSENIRWWSLNELEADGDTEYVVDARLLGFDRSGFGDVTASGVPFFVTPGNYESMIIKTRSGDQLIENTYEFSLGKCVSEVAASDPHTDPETSESPGNPPISSPSDMPDDLSSDEPAG